MPARIYTIYLLVCSLVTFILYAVDKSRAKRGEWRISEAMLLSCSLLGGGVGGYLAMHAVRHKTKKWYFHLINLLGIAWQLLLLFWLFTEYA